jgi:hypothetical protein
MEGSAQAYVSRPNEVHASALARAGSLAFRLLVTGALGPSGLLVIAFQ